MCQHFDLQASALVFICVKLRVNQTMLCVNFLFQAGAELVEVSELRAALQEREEQIHRLKEELKAATEAQVSV